MSVDPKTLPKIYQEQIAKKMLYALHDKNGGVKNGAERQRKYNNTPEERSGENGAKIRFASKAEARRYDELMLLLKAGKIRNLKLQPEFTLQEAYTTPEGARVRAIRYRADYSYERLISLNGGYGESWFPCVEDVKSPASKTRVYEIKKKLLRERFGVEIVEVE